MFGNKDAKRSSSNNGRPSTNGNPSPAGVNTIDRQTTIRGNVEAGGDIRIDGTLLGDLVCKAKLIIGEQGRVEGDVDCRGAIIEGSYVGNILVRDLLTLKETARIEGSIRTRKMAVEAGCLIDGQCTVTGEADPATDTVKTLGPAQKNKLVGASQTKPAEA